MGWASGPNQAERSFSLLPEVRNKVPHRYTMTLSLTDCLAEYPGYQYIDQSILAIEILDWQCRLQDHCQHMRDEQSHPEGDDIGYDD